jgi:hypothetical protein
MENMESKEVKVFEKEKNIVAIDPDKHSEVAIKRKSIPKKEESNDETKKCSFKEHEDKEATNYCYNCKLYLCDECADYHKGLLENHLIDNLDNISNETFTGLCKEENHNLKLEYYCKNHNILCCGLCICKIKGNGNGQHNECDICLIKDIKEDKKSKLKDNIEKLEKFLDELDETSKNMKITPEKVKEYKDKLKTEMKDVFEKIRTELNDREKILSSKVEKYIDENYFNEGIVKKQDKIKSLLDDAALFEEDDWEDDNKLNQLIDNCINLENNLKDINMIKEKMEQYQKNDKFTVKFNSDIDNFITEIKKFGYISDSIILKEQDNINKFNELINDDKITNNMYLLYRSSRDEFNYLNIVKQINNKTNLLFLYLTENDKIFGVYINTKLENMDLEGTKKYYKDENAFVFSLNNDKKYKILIPEYAIGFDNKNYILIGNNDKDNNGLYYSDNIINDNKLIDGEKVYDFSKNSELTEGSGKLIELEIFEINQN